MAIQSGTVGDVLKFPVTLVNPDGTTQAMDYSLALTLQVVITDPFGTATTYPAVLDTGTTNVAKILTVATMFPAKGTFLAEVVATFAGNPTPVTKSAVAVLKILQSLV